ncbi:clathrin light chain [Halteromyces radiatus]|uniref:clathrin light chain n=1 Tax=Halteromyces radiatus TaxID=101107 RepID=UPI002220870D|nr:clathrin light chain [Halteromyces radiatus]KAI8089511.1 clathrin light chain [Halteromyces radiatus]
MSDFGDFNTSSDPTSDFLARERAALGADADLFNMDAPITTTNTTDFPAITADTSSFQPSSSFDNSLALTSSSNDALAVTSTSNDYSAFDSDFPKAEELETSQAFHKAMLPDEEPAVVRQWREKQQELIAQRDQEAENKKQETIQKAREDIDRFYEEYNEKKQKSIEENRAREENYQKDREETSSSNNIWERVVREFDVTNAKSGHHTRDVSRMKQVMLDLRKVDNAPGNIITQA